MLAGKMLGVVDGVEKNGSVSVCKYGHCARDSPVCPIMARHLLQLEIGFRNYGDGQEVPGRGFGSCLNACP
jgi:hypothetical protein